MNDPFFIGLDSKIRRKLYSARRLSPTLYRYVMRQYSMYRAVAVRRLFFCTDFRKTGTSSEIFLNPKMSAFPYETF